jgi:serine/threonine-protein kinase
MYRGSDGKPPSLQQARDAAIPPLPERGYPEESKLHAIVARALVKDPVERYGSAREFLGELEEYIAESRMFASPLRLGEWLLDHFGNEIVETRSARERAAKAVEAGPLLQIRHSDDGDGDVAAPVEAGPVSSRRAPPSSGARVSRPAPASVRPAPRSARSAPEPQRVAAAPLVLAGLAVVVLLWAWFFR